MRGKGKGGRGIKRGRKGRPLAKKRRGGGSQPAHKKLVGPHVGKKKSCRGKIKATQSCDMLSVQKSEKKKKFGYGSLKKPLTWEDQG